VNQTHISEQVQPYNDVYQLARDVQRPGLHFAEDAKQCFDRTCFTTSYLPVTFSQPSKQSLKIIVDKTQPLSRPSEYFLTFWELHDPASPRRSHPRQNWRICFSHATLPTHTLIDRPAWMSTRSSRARSLQVCSYML
jgi:hypothetical protein